MKSSFLVRLGFILLLISLMGCGSGGTNVGSQTGSVTAQLHWIERTSSSGISSGKQIATAPQGVVTVRIVVSGSDMSNIQQDFPASAGTGVIGGVPVGSNRILTAQGLDASGVVTHQGVINNITVQLGQTTDAGIVVMYPAGQTFSVSGTVTLNGSGLPGVTVSLQGTSFSGTTGSDGTYSIPNVPNMPYTVIPSLTGYTFTPATRSVPDNNGDTTGQDFTATLIPPQTFTVSGSVTLNGSGLSGVTVSLQGTAFSTVTASDGTYSLTGVPNGSYTVTPSLTGYTFTPTNLLVTVNNANVTGQNFTATVLSYTISGTITLNGSGLSGVTVSLTGTSTNSVTTASDGTYSFPGAQNGLYTVTPSLGGYTFTPANRSVSVSNANVTGQDFTATPITLGNLVRITSGPDGNLWFTAYSIANIGRITPAGVLTLFSVPGSTPWGITSGPDGNIWFTDYYGNRVWLISPAGVVFEFPPLPTAGSFPEGITSGPDGNLWFVENSGGNNIGRITPAGVVTEFPIPTEGSQGDEITLGPDGNLWFAEYAGNKIGRITPAGVVTEFPPLPTEGASPGGITSGPDGNIWFIELVGNKIGRITLAGVVTEFPPLPTEGAGLGGMTSGPDGNLWFTECNVGKIGRITPAGVVTEFPIPTAGACPVGITSGPDGNLWFTDSGNNGKIGRITPAGAITEFP